MFQNDTRNNLVLPVQQYFRQHELNIALFMDKFIKISHKFEIVILRALREKCTNTEYLQKKLRIWTLFTQRWSKVISILADKDNAIVSVLVKLILKMCRIVFMFYFLYFFGCCLISMKLSHIVIIVMPYIANNLGLIEKGIRIGTLL